MNTYEQLKNLDLQNASPQTILSILQNCKLLKTECQINPGTFIYRSRRGHNFFKRKDLTYRPAEDCKEIQRATLPEHTMFYGVITNDQSHMEKARYITLLESSKLIRAGRDSIGREFFSVSCWEVIKPLKVISLITDQTFAHVKDNSLLNYFRDKHTTTWAEKNTTSEERDVAQFINNEFEKTVQDEKDYLISATVATELLKQYDAIVYPSVQAEGNAGLNIAISPEAVDDKLKYFRVIGSTLFKNGDKSHLRMDFARDVGKLPNYKIQQASLEEIARDLGVKSVYELQLIQ